MRANELNQLFMNAKDAVLKVIFSGGVLKGNKLQRGSVFLLSDILNKKNFPGQGPDSNNLQNQIKQLNRIYEHFDLVKQVVPPNKDPSSQVAQELNDDSQARFSKLF